MLQIEVFSRIADGYRNSPDLRLSWLRNMAKRHESFGNLAEAAEVMQCVHAHIMCSHALQCYIHAAALVAEYLNLTEVQPGLPVGCIAFQHISRDIEATESAANNDAVSPDQVQKHIQ